MKKRKNPSYHRRVRDILNARQNQTINEILEQVPEAKHRATIYRVLRAMPDAYVSDWGLSRTGHREAFWSVSPRREDALPIVAKKMKRAPLMGKAVVADRLRRLRQEGGE